MKEDTACHFGIEIEFTANLAMVQVLLPLLDEYTDILLRSTTLQDGFLFRDPSIVPNGIFDYGFEIKTKKLNTVFANYDRVAQLLIDLNRTVTANDTCSIHMHFSRESNSLRNHYMTLYEYLKLGYAAKYRWVGEYEMANENYADYKKCKRKYLYTVTNQINTNGCYVIDDAYDSKQFLYTINTLYNTIEYRGIRHHFNNEVPIQDIITQLIEVIGVFITIDRTELIAQYKDKFKIKP